MIFSAAFNLREVNATGLRPSGPSRSTTASISFFNTSVVTITGKSYPNVFKTGAVFTISFKVFECFCRSFIPNETGICA